MKKQYWYPRFTILFLDVYLNFLSWTLPGFCGRPSTTVLNTFSVIFNCFFFAMKHRKKNSKNLRPRGVSALNRRGEAVPLVVFLFLFSSIVFFRVACPVASHRARVPLFLCVFFCRFFPRCQVEATAVSSASAPLDRPTEQVSPSVARNVLILRSVVWSFLLIRSDSHLFLFFSIFYFIFMMAPTLLSVRNGLVSPYGLHQLLLGFFFLVSFFTGFYQVVFFRLN